MRFFQRRSVLLILLACLFLMPGLAAILFYQHPQWLSSHTINKGVFIKPPLFVKALHGQWGLVLWYPRVCDQSCTAQLERAHRILLALGRRYSHIKLWCMQDEQSLRDNTVFEKMRVLQTLGIAPKTSPLFHALGEQPRFYIVNPQGFLILSYPLSVASKDIYQDLQQLFRAEGG